MVYPLPVSQKSIPFVVYHLPVSQMSIPFVGYHLPLSQCTLCSLPLPRSISLVCTFCCVLLAFILCQWVYFYGVPLACTLCLYLKSVCVCVFFVVYPSSLSIVAVSNGCTFGGVPFAFTLHQVSSSFANFLNRRIVINRLTILDKDTRCPLLSLVNQIPFFEGDEDQTNQAQ